VRCIRIGTSLTRSREDRFSETDPSAPDNASIYNSDGVLAFASPCEYAGGLKLYLLPTERWWLTAELARVHKASYSGAFTPYTAGMDGWVPMLQTILAF
jgi:hypothetical protein